MITFMRGLACALLAGLAGASVVSGQTPHTTELQRRIEQLRVSGQLAVGYTTIAHSSLLANLYEQGAYAPLWTDARAAQDLVRVLRAVAADGLDPANYNLTAIEELTVARSTPAGAAELDLLRTDALLRVAYDLGYGTVAPGRLDPRRVHGLGVISDAELRELQG